jgi:hypothetical protein
MLCTDESARYSLISPKKDSATPDPRSSSVISNSVRRPESHVFANLSRTTTVPSRTGVPSDLPDDFPGMAPDSAVKKSDGTPGPGYDFQDYKEDNTQVEQ